MLSSLARLENRLQASGSTRKKVFSILEYIRNVSLPVETRQTRVDNNARRSRFVYYILIGYNNILTNTLGVLLGVCLLKFSLGSQKENRQVRIVKHTPIRHDTSCAIIIGNIHPVNDRIF